MAQTITVPEDLFERLERTAKALHTPVEEVARRALVAGLPPGVDDVPEPHRTELERLDGYSDEALWDIWHGRPTTEQAEQHAALLHKSATSDLTAAALHKNCPIGPGLPAAVACVQVGGPAAYRLLPDICAKPTAAEEAELQRLREQADGVLLRRAHAAALLRWRGHAVPINE